MKKNTLSMVGMILVLSTATRAHATYERQHVQECKKSNTWTNKMDIKLLQAASGEYHLQLAMNNPSGSQFVLTISDENGNILYKGNYNQQNFLLNVKLLHDDASSRFFFTIASNDKSIAQKVTISPVTRVIEEINISR